MVLCSIQQKSSWPFLSLEYVVIMFLNFGNFLVSYSYKKIIIKKRWKRKTKGRIILFCVATGTFCHSYKKQLQTLHQIQAYLPGSFWSKRISVFTFKMRMHLKTRTARICKKELQTLLAIRGWLKCKIQSSLAKHNFQ